MSTYSEGLGPEEEDGGGWSGLVPSAEEKRQEKAEKSSSEIWNEAVREPAVETRLTAEQFLAQQGLADLSLYWPTGKPLPKIDYESKEAAPTLLQLLEAFRDKSEAKLRAKLAEQGKPTPDGGALVNPTAQQEEWIAAIEQAECQIESFAPLTLTNIKALRAEAEAAALRERERWIRVEEKLPEANGEYQIAEKYLEVSTADFFADDKTWKTVRCYGMDAEERELYNVTHWKALSAAPETTK